MGLAPYCYAAADSHPIRAMSASTMISFAAFPAAAGCSCPALLFPAAAEASSPCSRRRPRFCFSSNTMPSGRADPVACSVAVARRCECFDLHHQMVPFAESWAWQQSIVTRRKGLVDREEDHSDTIVVLQHPPVYTLGTDSTDDYLHFSVKDAPFEIHRIDRGGEVTYHGPGQLVIYPILNLRYHKMDLHWYLRSLEEVIIRALQSAFSIKASRIKGLTGVWVGDQKIAAIGIHVSRWIAYHGLALNVTTDLTPFQLIVPCGIKDCGVGSIKEILQNTPNGREIDETILMDIAYNSLIKEFAEVFQLSLDLRPDCIQAF